jgi:hypothetical protein
MRAATYQVAIGELFELVVRAHVEHLVPAMRHVEGGTQKNGMLLLPILRRDDQLVANMRRDITVRRTFAQDAEDVFATLVLIFLPVYVTRVVGYGGQDV